MDHKSLHFSESNMIYDAVEESIVQSLLFDHTAEWNQMLNKKIIISWFLEMSFSWHVCAPCLLYRNSCSLLVDSLWNLFVNLIILFHLSNANLKSQVTENYFTFYTKCFVVKFGKRIPFYACEFLIAVSSKFLRKIICYIVIIGHLYSVFQKLLEWF